MDNQVLSSNFETHYGEAPALIAHAPGRVNIIGEHTDYNEGFVFPAAINFGTWVAATKRADNDIVVTAMDYENQQNSSRCQTLTMTKNKGGQTMFAA